MAFYDSISLEKGMYHVAGKTFTEVLEGLDSSEHYKNTPLEGLDAYERQLKRFDIRVSGPKSDVVEKFFATTDSAALFPEYVSRSVHQGMEETNILDQVVACRTKIDSMDYRSLACDMAAEHKQLARVAEGAEIPQVPIYLQENLVRLKKRGRVLVSSYEAVRFQRIDLFAVMLRQIGSYLATTQLSDAVDILLHGDGNDNAAQKVSLAQAGKPTYAELLKLWDALGPYEFNTLLASPDMVMALLELSDFKDPLTGLNFQTTGRLNTPLGAQLFKVSSMPKNTMLGLDRKCALEMVMAGDLTVDYDKLIDRQLERASVTSIYGFAKIFQSASVCLA